MPTTRHELRATVHNGLEPARGVYVPARSQFRFTPLGSRQAGLEAICRVVLCLLCFFLAGSTALAQVAPVRLGIGIQTNPPAAQIRVIGPAGGVTHLEASSNLVTWLPLATIEHTNGTVLFVDPQFARGPYLFYRALQMLEPAAAGLTLSRFNGPPGTELVIRGRSFVPEKPGDIVVFLGGVQAPVREVTADSLVVEVPAGATVGPVRVITPQGIEEGPGDFIVTGMATGRFTPPPGLNAADFQVLNTFGAASDAGGPGNECIIPVRAGLPLVTMAAPKDTNRAVFFAVVTLTADQPFLIDAASTAEALVFTQPLFMTLDPVLAEQVLGVIRADPVVQRFGQVITQLFPQPGDPGTNTIFLDAYADAVLSVATNAPLRALASVLEAQRAERVAREMSSSSTADWQSDPGVRAPRPVRKASAGNAGLPPRTVSPYEIDLDFIRVITRGSDAEGKLGPDQAKFIGFPFNPVDWVMVVQEIDVERAFPNGSLDLRGAYQGGLTAFPWHLRDGFRYDGSVSADLAFSRVNVVNYLVATFITQLGAAFGNPAMTLPDRDAVYIVRGIGPAFHSQTDLDFVRAHYADERFRVMLINLLAAAMDLVSGYTDLRDALGTPDSVRRLGEKILFQVNRTIPSINSATDFKQVVQDMAKALGEFLADEAKDEIGRRAESAGRKILDWGKSIAGKVLGLLGTVAGVGQVAERASGLLRTTALEEGFLVMGDPFRLEILRVEAPDGTRLDPPRANLGQEIAIVIRGARFELDDRHDKILFGTSDLIFDGIPLTVADLGDGTQRITVRLPSNVNDARETEVGMKVLAQGRSGTSPFRLIDQPLVTSMTPQSGFAAVWDGLRYRFRGTAVRLRGFSFSPDDTFIFDGGIIGTNTSGTAGDVTVYIPPNAATGPITVRRRAVPGADLPPGEGQSPTLTVWGPPAISSVTPNRGPSGTIVTVSGANFGDDPLLVEVRFRNLNIDAFTLRSTTEIQASVPLVPPANVKLSVTTPAGRAQADFTVESGRASGAILLVFPDGVLTFERALAIAGGTAATNIHDDADFNSATGQSLDPPYEEGDYILPDMGPGAGPLRWPVGAAYADEISVFTNVIGRFRVTGDFDTISVFATYTLDGQLTVVGSHNSIGITAIRGTANAGPGLILLGHHNKIVASVTNHLGDGVRIDGGSFNILELIALAGNSGNGITLTGGARGNNLLLHSTFGQQNLVTGEPVPLSGNRGHGVYLTGAARGNVIRGEVIGNHLDGVRLDGPEVVFNHLLLDADANSLNGYTFTNSARSNVVGRATNLLDSARAELNGQNGFALYSEPGAGAQGNVLANVFASRNGQAGVLISGLAEPGVPTRHLIATRDNQKAGLRLERGSAGLQAELSSLRDATGLELDGSNVVNHAITATVTDAAGTGVTLTNASSNVLQLTVINSGGDGAVLSGGTNNELVMRAERNRGDGLRLSRGAAGNRVRSRAQFTTRFLGNGTGIVLEDGPRDNLIENVLVRTNQGHGIVLRGAETQGNRIVRTGTGGIELNGGDGIRIDGGAHQNEVGSELGAGQNVLHNAGAGIRIAGPGTYGNAIRGNLISSTNTTAEGGIVIENQARDNPIGGLGERERNLIVRNSDGIVIRSGAESTLIQNNLIQDNTGRGISIQNAPRVWIGGYEPASPNELRRNGVGIEVSGAAAVESGIVANQIIENTVGIRLQAGARATSVQGNVIESNQSGIVISGASSNWVAQNWIRLNPIAGVVLDGGAAGIRIEDNRLISLNGVGVRVEGAATLRNTIRCSAITANAGLGIQLLNGGNRALPAPVLTSVSSSSVLGTAAVPNGSLIELFQDGDDEGLRCIGGATVLNGRFRVSVDLNPALVGLWFKLTATATDPEGNTSQFGLLDPLSGTTPASVVFTSNRDGNRELYLLDPLGTGETRLTEHTADDYDPSFAPGANRIAFVSARDGNPEIYVMQALPGAVPTRLTFHNAPDYEPTWSPQGGTLAFVSERDGDPEIYLMATNGTGLARLTQHPGADRWPAVSPDGTQIAFASERNGNFEVFVVNTDGTNLRAITSHPAPDTQPAWSPDGRQLVFVSERDGNLELYSMRTDGTDLRRLTDHPGADMNPAWLPAGAGYVFASNRDEGFELYLVRLMGGPALRLTVSTGDNTLPDAAR